jgi:DHA1 family multidrug resistance protein-like MFS transporter
MYAASALAANTVCRSACGAAAPLFTKYMFDALGVGGGGSLIGGIAVLLAPIPFVFYKYGGPIRKRSKFAPTPEKDEHQDEETVESRASTETDVSSIASEGEHIVEEHEMKPHPSHAAPCEETATEKDVDAERDLEKAESRRSQKDILDKEW